VATDEDVRAMIGQVVLPDLWRCPYCGAPWRVLGPWHPGGQVGAYLVVGCWGCKATANGGAP
jgi:hypothetical protein